MSRRYWMEREGGELEVWLPSQLRIPTLLIGVWLLVYSVPALLGGTPVVIEGIRRYATDVPARFGPWVTAVLYVAWAVVGFGPAVAGLLLVGYQFLGWERVRVDARRVSVRREVAGLGWRRRFPLATLVEARLAPTPRMKRWFVGGGTIVLGSGEKQFRLGASLKPAEAAEVLRELTAGVEQHAG